MGTNFYYFKEKPDFKKQCVDGGLHIGKRSAGWVFHFEAHPNLSTVQRYKDFLKKGYIYDEYENSLSYDEFWEEVVKDTKNLYFGKTPYDFSDYEYHIDGISEWMDEGYMFTLGNFC